MHLQACIVGVFVDRLCDRVSERNIHEFENGSQFSLHVCYKILVADQVVTGKNWEVHRNAKLRQAGWSIFNPSCFVLFWPEVFPELEVLHHGIAEHIQLEESGPVFQIVPHWQVDGSGIPDQVNDLYESKQERFRERNFSSILAFSARNHNYMPNSQISQSHG